MMDELFAGAPAVPDGAAAFATIRAIQRKVAVSALPASALRGQRTPGLIRCARDFFTDLQLIQFGVTEIDAFVTALDEVTHELLATFPKTARRWGIARKAVNLFLRDAYYNQFLATEYGLSGAAAFYELPLDSYTARALDEFDDERDLPTWRTVAQLTESDSAEYQEAATDMAAEYDCVRVHLDAYIWGRPR